MADPRKRAWDAERAGVPIETAFSGRSAVLEADTAAEVLAQLAWIVRPSDPADEPPRARVSAKLAAGGEPGRWLVIWKTGESDGPYSKDVARRVLKAKRQTAPGSNAWMLNIDEIDLRQFDDFCKAAWVFPWLGKWRYFNAWTDPAGEVRLAGPRNLIEAKAHWLAQREMAKDPQFRIREPFVMDSKTGLPLFPRNYGQKQRSNPGRVSKTPAMIRHAVLAIAERLLELDPGLDDAAVVRQAHALAWAAAQSRGWVRKGSRALTRAGADRDQRHSREPDAPAKDARYEALLHQARANPSGRPFSGTAVVDAGAGPRAVVLYRGRIAAPDGRITRPRRYYDPQDPLLARVLDGYAAADAAMNVAHQKKSDRMRAVVPKRRRKETSP